MKNNIGKVTKIIMRNKNDLSFLYAWKMYRMRCMPQFDYPNKCPIKVKN